MKRASTSLLDQQIVANGRRTVAPGKLEDEKPLSLKRRSDDRLVRTFGLTF